VPQAAVRDSIDRCGGIQYICSLHNAGTAHMLPVRSWELRLVFAHECCTVTLDEQSSSTRYCSTCRPCSITIVDSSSSSTHYGDHGVCGQQNLFCTDVSIMASRISQLHRHPMGQRSSVLADNAQTAVCALSGALRLQQQQVHDVTTSRHVPAATAAYLCPARLLNINFRCVHRHWNECCVQQHTKQIYTAAGSAVPP
jgi:hypothetical protein